MGGLGWVLVLASWVGLGWVGLGEKMDPCPSLVHGAVHRWTISVSDALRDLARPSQVLSTWFH